MGRLLLRIKTCAHFFSYWISKCGNSSVHFRRALYLLTSIIVALPAKVFPVVFSFFYTVYNNPTDSNQGHTSSSAVAPSDSSIDCRGCVLSPSITNSPLSLLTSLLQHDCEQYLIISHEIYPTFSYFPHYPTVPAQLTVRQHTSSSAVPPSGSSTDCRGCVNDGFW